jgi:hypothetical protein
MLDLRGTVAFGIFLRNMHRCGAQLAKLPHSS